MGKPVRLTSVREARAAIARHIVGFGDRVVSVGSVALRAHQVDGCARIRAAFAEFGGALLCDDVGLGKTYIATAVASVFESVLVIAPAALRSMWFDALDSSGVKADFISIERLSRLKPTDIRGCYDLAVVDEAHHFRNRSTRRYRLLSHITREARTLMLTATPVHNDAGDLRSLLGVFLGRRGARLTEDEMSRCIIRRADIELKVGAGIPTVAPTVHIDIDDHPNVISAILALPPPVPVRDGGLARDLVMRGLIHQWASSEAALREAVRRRRGRGHALVAALQAGTHPTARELSTWTCDDGTVQLGFAELLAKPVERPRELLDCVNSHLQGLEQLASVCQTESRLDRIRARHVLDILHGHPGERIVAFAQYEQTVRSLYRNLGGTGGIALLTAGGARIASGPVPRAFVLAQFGSDPAHVPVSQRIDLLLTTDILSEGVNLQGASVVIHLDLPWTAARLDQRVGRVARIGSKHESVAVYMLRSPLSARKFLETERIVTAKWSLARRTVGVTSPDPFGSTAVVNPATAAVPELTDSLLSILKTWLGQEEPAPADSTIVASVTAPAPGFLAAISILDERVLVSAYEEIVSTDLRALIAAARVCAGKEAPVNPDDAATAVRLLEAWGETRSTHYLTGTTESSRVVHRPRLLARIDAIIARSPLHLRAARGQKAALARQIAIATHGAVVEDILHQLERSDSSDDSFLDAIISVAPRPERETHAPGQGRLVIDAIVLFGPSRPLAS